MKINKIKIEGSYFSPSTELRLFTNDKNRVSLVYGRNGSGKSTLARAIEEYKNGKFLELTDVIFYTSDSKVLQLSNKEKEQIYVFNEDFVDKNIKVDDDKINSIVMFGEQVELDEDLKEKERILEGIYKKLDSLDLEKFNDPKSTISPLYFQRAIDNNLRGNWASRYMRIDKAPRRPSVNDKSREQVYNTKIESSKVELNKKYEELIQLYENIKEDSTKIEDEVKKLPINVETFENISKLLSIKIENFVSDKLENRIIDTINNKTNDFIQSARSDFADNSVDYCPYCYQDLSSEYKADLINAIKNVLNEDVENHKFDLKQSKIESVSILEGLIINVDPRLCSKINTSISDLNNIIEQVNSLIDSKINNVFDPIEFKLDNLEINTIGDIIIRINNLFAEVEDKRLSHNSNIENVSKIHEQLHLINNQLAHIEISNEYRGLQTSLKSQKTSEIEKDNLNKKINEISKEINVARAKLKNTKIALDIINKNLQYIFFDNNRLVLEAKDNSYCIKSRGEYITKLNKLSSGERNAIALCYFFSMILNNCAEDKIFSDKSLVVLDDPITDFDIDNKIGIYSYLSKMFKNILKGNSESRIVILTHKIETMLNLVNTIDDIKKSADLPEIDCRLILENKKIDNFGKNYNDYKTLLETIYKYASNGDMQLDPFIGNIMRRVIEAFSSFNYNVGITELSTDEIILSTISSPQKREYFENLMYRLLLHNESHFENKIKGITEDGIESYMFHDDKVKTAKNILVYLYTLNEKHIEKYFKDNKKAIKDIKLWDAALTA